MSKFSIFRRLLQFNYDNFESIRYEKILFFILGPYQFICTVVFVLNMRDTNKLRNASAALYFAT